MALQVYRFLCRISSDYTSVWCKEAFFVSTSCLSASIKASEMAHSVSVTVKGGSSAGGGRGGSESL